MLRQCKNAKCLELFDILVVPYMLNNGQASATYLVVEIKPDAARVVMNLETGLIMKLIHLTDDMLSDYAYLKYSDAV